MTPLDLIKCCIRGIATPFFRLRKKQPAEIENIFVKANNLPDALHGYKLAVVADLHLPDNLTETGLLLAQIQQERPDVIVLAGDITNRYNRVYPDEAIAFLKQLTAIAPVFAIAGNHERPAARLSIYREVLADAGIAFLHDALASIEYKGENLYIYGVFDPDKTLPKAFPHPTVLLVHHPESAVKAASCGCVCAVCGHAHGGQVRFGKRGLFSPGQGFFPRYISGRYDVNGFPVVVSRGLGDSSIPIRIKNRPHLPVITIINK